MYLRNAADTVHQDRWKTAPIAGWSLPAPLIVLRLARLYKPL